MKHSTGTTVMDFFGFQEKAEKRIRWYILLFIVAVICIITLLTLGIGVCIWLSGLVPPEESIWKLEWMAALAAIASIFIFGVSWIEIRRLRGGGAVLAESLRASPVPLNTQDPDERRLLNVVEEVAIAAGVPVPEAYIMKRQNTINAFAAGHTLEDAVIGVSEGCIRHLDREELQGVVAHEFSHIINGDMRVNIRLLGIIFGIMYVEHLGQKFFDSDDDSWSGGWGRSGGGRAFLLGIVLIIVGYIGVFFGRLIQVAVARQQEYYADAAAVQFTRNPEAIAGALKKTGGAPSRIYSPYAEDAAHIFFNQPASNTFRSHPPLECRMRGTPCQGPLGGKVKV